MTQRQFATCFVLVSALTAFLTPKVPGQRVQTADASAAHPNNAERAKTERFLRLRRDAEGRPLALQTSLTRYEDADRKTVVDLIGAVHIGETGYYKRLNKQFTLYDAVLYELVAPTGTRVPRGERPPGNPIAWLQQTAQNLLGLESQLEQIDYQRDNFVHADLSPQQIGDKMRERGDTPLTLGLTALAEMLREQNRAAADATEAPSAGEVGLEAMSWEDLVDLLGDPLQLKQLLAEQFAQSGALDGGLGPSLNRLLIGDRNQAAMDVLHRELDRGKRKIAIFYGAAHLPDLDQRIVNELGFERTHHVWVDAWDLTRAPQPSQAANPAAWFQQILKSLDR